MQLEGKCYCEKLLYPSKGNIYIDILIYLRGVPEGYGSSADIFWDDLNTLLGSDKQVFWIRAPNILSVVYSGKPHS
jgi:hypothetical protein